MNADRPAHYGGSVDIVIYTSATEMRAAVSLALPLYAPEA